MTAPRRARVMRLPDPSDPANLGWWQAYDLLHTIAHQAQQITHAARAAQMRMSSGHEPDVTVLAAELDRWIWHPSSLDIITGYQSTHDQQPKPLRRAR